ncbi:hypothetical protein E2C01_088705 [Portunus trituberculatus]|uniref:Uncharacterized protein n=1 Tax=Portunus trituberculatus TaxID=210409 RepID=A0A5B7JBG6_PORTR|nr:hypothetical protein [Portunus trituberculatus]
MERLNKEARERKKVEVKMERKRRKKKGSGRENACMASWEMCARKKEEEEGLEDWLAGRLGVRQQVLGQRWACIEVAGGGGGGSRMREINSLPSLRRQFVVKAGRGGRR